MAPRSHARPRLFFDSGVFLEGLLAAWSVSRALLILAHRRRVQIVLAQDVREEIEQNLTSLVRIEPSAGERAIEAYDKLLDRLRVETVAATTTAEVLRHRHLIRHQADVPILVAAMKTKPDCLVTTNRRHFNQDVSRHTGLRIGTPREIIERVTLLP